MSAPEWIVLDASEFVESIVRGALYDADQKACDHVADEIQRQLKEGPGVVVIDPEDWGDVRQLILALAKTGYVLGPRGGDARAALRSLLSTPKPPEPLGRYAVVVDASASEWVKTGEGGPDNWLASGEFTAGQWTRYADIKAVRVLSEGVVTP